MRRDCVVHRNKLSLAQDICRRTNNTFDPHADGTGMERSGKVERIRPSDDFASQSSRPVPRNRDPTEPGYRPQAIRSIERNASHSLK